MSQLLERPFGREIVDCLHDCISEAKKSLGSHYATATPLQLVEGIQEYLSRWHREGAEETKDSERIKRLLMNFGSLWGELLVMQLGWEWAQIQYIERSFAFGVVSPDRSLIAYPFDCVEKILNDPISNIDLAKSFQRLVSGPFPESKPKSFTMINLEA